ncbi:4Fe-4S binding protein [Saccharicrinis fermentans]|uniref:Putative electron transport protein YccM n=1 Tax=Saccharicrinis fermentans DSM 9555 = JCM 21142 TaxID=869213 RepID=W7YEI8_9BACT|nr:4Fe-4S binding protein [Saccharicrinis fermentans]GAF05888.1 putative electron transport protein YccM [Saccharicrinis fermentans DSM 9555 = JCM 21142]
MQSKFIESASNTLLLLLFFMAAVSYNGKLFGYKSQDLLSGKKEFVEILPPTHTQLEHLGLENMQLEEDSKGIWRIKNSSENERVVNTLAFSKGIYGFGGPIPMYLYLDKSNTIKQIVLGENSETPDFLASVLQDGIVSQWLGKNTEKMSNIMPDALSGATMTSNAINFSIQKTLDVVDNKSSSRYWWTVLDIKTIIALLVIFLGLIISSIKSKKKKHLRTAMLVLNTGVLGIWCGKFISLNILLGWVANGMNLLTSGVVFLMLLLSVLMPLFFKNKKSYYCNWICPFGSAQELAGRLSKKKIKIGAKFMQILKHTREVITLCVFVGMWLGMASDIANYEPFSAFIFQHASVAVLLIAGLGMLTAVFISRPWCRFVCPTGQVLSWMNKMN